ncbi:hypothetical protein BHM03_00046249 [Ensete ventricosum]|nr:hypothetical protein BHM03_00046249 [Ensete ventricosum]
MQKATATTTRMESEGYSGRWRWRRHRRSDAKNRVNMVSVSGLEALTRRKFLQTSSSNELGVNQYRRWLELICCRY